ncbi:hypothetical protein [Deinococcus marmoris]|uniref:hypothetical protein n=1 Tax=Deinococcus marmoris TaxID=249408 RepID=UPI000497A3C7|nr:hypothetical protein [Deinococcus marmoris]
MSSTPYTLILLVPTEYAKLPPAGAALHWTQTPCEENAEVWSVHPASRTDAELDTWHHAEQQGEDVPLVQVAYALSDQRHSPIADHALMRLSLPTSLRRTVRAAPHGWRVALQVINALNVTFAWSASDDALDALWTRGTSPWAQVWPTMVFHEEFLERLRLDPLNLDNIAGGGNVFRLQRRVPHWLLGNPEGLGNESAALLDGGAVDDALIFALQRMSSQHADAVRRWLQEAHTP